MRAYSIDQYHPFLLSVSYISCMSRMFFVCFSPKKYGYFSTRWFLSEQVGEVKSKNWGWLRLFLVSLFQNFMSDDNSVNCVKPRNKNIAVIQRFCLCVWEFSLWVRLRLLLSRWFSSCWTNWKHCISVSVQFRFGLQWWPSSLCRKSTVVGSKKILLQWMIHSNGRGHACSNVWSHLNTQTSTNWVWNA